MILIANLNSLRLCSREMNSVPRLNKTVLEIYPFNLVPGNMSPALTDHEKMLRSPARLFTIQIFAWMKCINSHLRLLGLIQNHLRSLTCDATKSFLNYVLFLTFSIIENLQSVMTIIHYHNMGNLEQLNHTENRRGKRGIHIK